MLRADRGRLAGDHRSGLTVRYAGDLKARNENVLLSWIDDQPPQSTANPLVLTDAKRERRVAYVGDRKPHHRFLSVNPCRHQGKNRDE